MQQFMRIIDTQIYRIIVPKFIRKKILAKVLRADVLKYYSGLSGPLSEEIEKVLTYLRNRSVKMFPYYFQDQYIESAIEVFNDPEKKLRFVLLDGKKLYFKKRWSKRRIRVSFNELLKEQDPLCPHCYENESFNFRNGDVLADIGAAEGNFALSVVEKASRIILFESSKEWIEPLNATFEPWKDKVTIVKKFVSDVNNPNCTRLDDFFAAEEKLSFLKIDVEGAESLVLSGCKRILQTQRPLKVAICTYHKADDEQEFKELLTTYGFETSHSDGYMLVYTDRKLKAPYLRRGLVRAVKH
jgi:hypothetical protein